MFTNSLFWFCVVDASNMNETVYETILEFSASLDKKFFFDVVIAIKFPLKLKCEYIKILDITQKHVS